MTISTVRDSFSTWYVYSDGFYIGRVIRDPNGFGFYFIYLDDVSEMYYEYIQAKHALVLYYKAISS